MIGKLVEISQQEQPRESTLPQSGVSSCYGDFFLQVVAGMCELRSERHGHVQKTSCPRTSPGSMFHSSKLPENPLAWLLSRQSHPSP